MWFKIFLLILHRETNKDLKIMRKDQELEVIRTGLINTLFSDINNLKKNFGMFFGNGIITLLEGQGWVFHQGTLKKGGIRLNIRSNEGVEPAYNRLFGIEYTMSNNKRFPYKIINIIECQS